MERAQAKALALLRSSRRRERAAHAAALAALQERLATAERQLQFSLSECRGDKGRLACARALLRAFAAEERQEEGREQREKEDVNQVVGGVILETPF